MSIVKGLAITFFSQMPVDTIQWRGEIGTFKNHKGPFCLLRTLIYAFVSVTSPNIFYFYGPFHF